MIFVLASVHYNQLHTESSPHTPYTDRELLGASVATNKLRNSDNIHKTYIYYSGFLYYTFYFTSLSCEKLSEWYWRRHYLTELELMKKREDERRMEDVSMLPPSFLEDVRQRNRIDRLRRACRDHMTAADQIDLDHLDVDPVLVVDADPLPYGNMFRWITFQSMNTKYQTFFLWNEVIHLTF